MGKKVTPGARRVIRHLRLRKKVLGNPARPRLCVFRSLRHIYAQIIDDTRGHTLATASSLELLGNGDRPEVDKKMMAQKVGLLVARRALEQSVRQVVFDRGGYTYHGRVKSLADSAREGGLSF